MSESVRAASHATLAGKARTFHWASYLLPPHTRDDAALVYAPGGRAVHLDLSRWTGPLAVRWFDPRTGRWQQADGVQAGSRVTIGHPFAGDDAVLKVGRPS